MSTLHYVPILLFVLVAIAFPVVVLALTRLIRPNHPDPVKLAPYECGIETQESQVWGRYPVHYYVIAVLFVIFDVETVFLFPWAVRAQVLGWFGFLEMVVFLVILVVAYVYAWKKGALQWV